MFIAHRGKVTNLSKENTLEAFIEAINDPKYLGFELDIRTTKDKRFVCIHDFFWKNMEHSVVIIRKICKTPKNYPRKAGKPSKQPII